jgi:hypothetical protein
VLKLPAITKAIAINFFEDFFNVGLVDDPLTLPVAHNEPVEFAQRCAMQPRIWTAGGGILTYQK